MNVHEQIDRIGGWTPRTKVVVALAAIVLVLVGAGGLMYLGYRWGTSWADSTYLQERQKNLEAIAVLEADAKRHLENEAQLAAQNSILKKQNEALAEVYSQADTKREQAAADQFAAREKERTADLNEIDADQSHDAIVCGTCETARKSGFPLSAEFCQRCTNGK